MIFAKTEKFTNEHFHSLYHRDFRYFFVGQLVSLVGSWMQVMAQAWLVYTITNSAFKLGVVSAMQFLPTLMFSLFAGVLVDKTSKRRILIITQVLSMLQAFVLFLLVYFGDVQYWHVLILAGILGCVNSVDMPARQSYVIELVDKKNVVNAIGLNSTIFNLARIVGPAIAGILMTGIGIEWCFFINAVSFVAPVISLLLINHRGNPVAAREKNMVDEIKNGLVYIYKTPVLLKTTLMIFFITLVGYNYNILIPVFAKTILGLQEKGFGILLSSFGAGSLIGALITSIKAGNTSPNPKILMTSSIAVGVALLLMGFASNIYAAMALLGLCGVFGIWFYTMANSILQLYSEDRYRGRIMSVYAIVFAGAMPIGNFIMGFITEYVGVKVTFMSAGIIIISVVSLTRLIRYYW